MGNESFDVHPYCTCTSDIVYTFHRCEWCLAERDFEKAQLAYSEAICSGYTMRVLKQYEELLTEASKRRDAVGNIVREQIRAQEQERIRVEQERLRLEAEHVAKQAREDDEVERWLAQA